MIRRFFTPCLLALWVAGPAWSENFIQVREKGGSNGETEIWVEFKPRVQCPWTVTFEMGKRNQTWVLRGSQHKKLTTFKKPEGASSTSYTVYAMLGDKDAVHSPHAKYELPYEVMEGFVVTQGFQGDFTHQGLGEFAVDFAMPEGTKVLAARSGLIVHIYDTETKTSTDPASGLEGNHVQILHEDDTIAYYGHLKYQGINVSVGQYVKAGEKIGLSGNTGISTGPHLHFEVHVPTHGTQRKTIPFVFNDPLKPRGRLLEQGQVY